MYPTIVASVPEVTLDEFPTTTDWLELLVSEPSVTERVMAPPFVLLLRPMEILSSPLMPLPAAIPIAILLSELELLSGDKSEPAPLPMAMF